jgi:HPt (histidine-containing phosphotransfer) domain-containing protein
MGAKIYDNVVGFLDTQTLEVRFFKDADFLSEILIRYRKTCADCLADLRAAGATRRPIEFANAAHKLKGSTLNFSKFYIANWLEEMETSARTMNQIPATDQELDHLESLIADLIGQLQDLVKRWRAS